MEELAGFDVDILVSWNFRHIVHFDKIRQFNAVSLKKLDLKSTKYVFAIATRLGTPHSAFTDIEKIFEKKGKCLDSYFALNMASNDPKRE